MLKFSAENFRSFQDLPSIEVKPITFFVGRNSSGKSTATRIIPLLQQTFSQRTSGPVLWTGGQVDFGTIQDVKPRWPDSGPTAFGFELDGNLVQDALLFASPPNGVSITSKKIRYKAILDAAEDSTVFCGFTLELNDDKVELRIGDRGRIDTLLVNDQDYSKKYEDVRAFNFNQSLFPDIRYVPSSSDAERRVRNESFSIFNERVSLIRHLSHGRTSQHKINEIATSILYRDKESFSSGVMRNLNLTNYFKENFSTFSKHSPKRVEELRISLLLTYLSRIIVAIGGIVRGIFSDAVYVGPIRASGERFYRWQELAVDRIDPRGENLAMYLTSLSDTDLERVSNLFQSSFGCRVRKQRSKGHISIEVSNEETGPNWFNIADMGHGFSQLLPIIAQVHAINTNRARRVRPRIFDDEIRRDERIIAIEQPELHLHPAFQGRLANLFERSIYRYTTTPPSKELSGIYYILETHSEALINSMGDLVAAGRVNSNDVAVYIFDKQTDGRTVVSRSEFDNDGLLGNWPPGFFLYEQK